MKLPGYVDWQKTALAIGGKITAKEAAARLDMSVYQVGAYRRGKCRSPRYSTAKSMLLLLAEVAPERLYECTGMIELPVIPESVDWAMIRRSIGTSKVRDDLFDVYEMTVHNQRTGRLDMPYWARSVEMLNDVQDQVSPGRYLELIGCDVREAA